jgi:nicotinate-nucleotide adenylyltransferase
MFLTLDRWYRAEELLRMARFAVAPRVEACMEELEQKAEELRERFGADAVVLNTPVLELSSTVIRLRMEQGDFSGLAPQVSAYIRAKGLFSMAQADVTTCSNVDS